METEHQLCQSPTKSPLKPKKAPVITRGEYYKVRVGSHGTKDLLLIGATADKDREGKKTNWYIQKCSYLTMTGRQLLYKELARNTSSQHFGLLQYLSMFNPVKWCLC